MTFTTFWVLAHSNRDAKHEFPQSTINFTQRIFRKRKNDRKKYFFIDFDNFSAEQIYLHWCSQNFTAFGTIWRNAKNRTKMTREILLVNIFWAYPVVNGKIELDFRILEHLWKVVTSLLGWVGWQVSILDPSTLRKRVFWVLKVRTRDFDPLNRWVKLVKFGKIRSAPPYLSCVQPPFRASRVRIHPER